MPVVYKRTQKDHVPSSPSMENGVLHISKYVYNNHCFIMFYYNVFCYIIMVSSYPLRIIEHY